jgi:hypothetical protein
MSTFMFRPHNSCKISAFSTPFDSDYSPISYVIGTNCDYEKYICAKCITHCIESQGCCGDDCITIDYMPYCSKECTCPDDFPIKYMFMLVSVEGNPIKTKPYDSVYRVQFSTGETTSKHFVEEILETFEFQHTLTIILQKKHDEYDEITSTSIKKICDETKKFKPTSYNDGIFDSSKKKADYAECYKHLIEEILAVQKKVVVQTPSIAPRKKK